MSLNISPEIAARLAAKAQEKGLSVDAFLDHLLSDAGDLTTSTATGQARELPVWNLGVRGSLHRRDIYDDVR
jgi:hypothetical protein